MHVRMKLEPTRGKGSDVSGRVRQDVDVVPSPVELESNTRLGGKAIVEDADGGVFERRITGKEVRELPERPTDAL